MLRHVALTLPLTLLALAVAGCSGGVEPCTVTPNDDGSTTITCPDGTSDTISPGADGRDGEDGETGQSAFVSIVDLPPGDENCEHGGIAITYGVEGADPEDLTTVYVCNQA